MIVCPECGNPAKKGYLFCPTDGCRFIEVDNILLIPGNRVNVHRVGTGTVIGANDEDYLDPDVLCYAIALDQEISPDIRNWYRKRTGVDTVKDWSLIEGQSLPTDIPPQKRYFAAHYEVVPITGDKKQTQFRQAYTDGGDTGSNRVCPTCGNRYDAVFSYCSNDGTALISADLADQPDHGTLAFKEERLSPHRHPEKRGLQVTGTQETLVRIDPLKSGITASQKEPSPFRDLLGHIDKKNSARWMKVFKTFEEEKYNLFWNWPSFFFGPIRYWLKGMWAKGLTYLLIILLFQKILISVFGGGIFFLTCLGAAVFFALMGANDYYLFCLKYREDIVGARNQKAWGITLVCMSPILFPLLLSVLHALF